MKTPKFINRFKRNTKAIAPLWGIACMTIIFFPLIFWCLSVFLDGVSSSVFGIYSFVGVTASAWTLVKTLISALPVFVLIIVVIWTAVNAKSQSYSD